LVWCHKRLTKNCSKNKGLSRNGVALFLLTAVLLTT